MMMMNSGGSTSCFSEATTSSSQQMYNPAGDKTVTATEASSGDDVVSSSLLYNLSILQEKIHQIQSFVGLLISQNHNDHDYGHDNHDRHHHHHHHQRFGSTSLAVASIGTLVQEIIAAASSMMFTCQQLHITPVYNNNYNNNDDRNSKNNNNFNGGNIMMEFSKQDMDPDQYFMQDDDFMQEGTREISFPNQKITQNLDWYKTPSHTDDHEIIIVSKSTNESILSSSSSNKRRSNSKTKLIGVKNYDIVELDAADLLAKYTHYCQICGKGFKRDANLRMHMRAHGDEYKKPEALINPMNRRVDDQTAVEMMKQKMKKHYYSCPHEGCRWNQRHVKFQPLKSIICVKNHYKRSHCPKMYVCRRCNVKQFSVLSDLRTHEKHCGDIKWVCSCGTRFSRKDKLMSHVGLFVGHAPVVAAATHGQVRAGNYLE